jgi:predicted solute-binding protein
MVFGVFACRKDAPIELIAEIHNDLMKNYHEFNTNPRKKIQVVENSSNQTGISNHRMEYYFDNEVRNSLDENSTEGLLLFLKEVCKIEESPIWANLSNHSE